MTTIELILPGLAAVGALLLDLIKAAVGGALGMWLFWKYRQWQTSSFDSEEPSTLEKLSGISVKKDANRETFVESFDDEFFDRAPFFQRPEIVVTARFAESNLRGLVEKYFGRDLSKQGLLDQEQVLKKYIDQWPDGRIGKLASSFLWLLGNDASWLGRGRLTSANLETAIRANGFWPRNADRLRLDGYRRRAI